MRVLQKLTKMVTRQPNLTLYKQPGWWSADRLNHMQPPPFKLWLRDAH